MIFKNYQDYLNKKENLSEVLKGKYGCIVEFNGFVREYDIKGGKRVSAKGLNVEEVVIEKLKEIRDEAIKKYDLIEVVIFHETGFLEVGERVASIAVFARHRKAAFLALAFIIDEMKKYH
ncbi:MAG: molybdenum cofactor biosynthesis protein MoaE [Thermodesulfobacterium sp.]|nr:molybdenum cofactor biosynthesis protein MoaE [Thermodesulfobacterium sp.]